MRCMRPAWRTSTYSSRFEAVMDRNLTRSRSGLVESSASSSTRRLNSIQERSRPLKSFGLGAILAMGPPFGPCWQSTAIGGGVLIGGVTAYVESMYCGAPIPVLCYGYNAFADSTRCTHRIHGIRQEHGRAPA